MDTAKCSQIHVKSQNTWPAILLRTLLTHGGMNLVLLKLSTTDTPAKEMLPNMCGWLPPQGGPSTKVRLAPWQTCSYYTTSHRAVASP